MHHADVGVEQIEALRYDVCQPAQTQRLAAEDRWRLVGMQEQPVVEPEAERWRELKSRAIVLVTVLPHTQSRDDRIRFRGETRQRGGPRVDDENDATRARPI